jgi:hypothetical protein
LTLPVDFLNSPSHRKSTNKHERAISILLETILHTMADRKRTVTIRFPKPDVVPPVYLAGSFSDPAWQPQEMQYTVDEEHGTTEYHKEVEVIEGKEYQYKFRIGDGDWWLLNEDSPTGKSLLCNGALCTLALHTRDREYLQIG